MRIAATQGRNRAHRNSTAHRNSSSSRAVPKTGQTAAELQAFGTIAPLPNGLSLKVCGESVAQLNQILADTMVLRDLYKKHHWQVAGPTFYPLHLLFDKHYDEQVAIVDQLAERIQLLGGLSLAMAPDVAETTRIPRAPKGREALPVQLSRLLEAHEVILRETRAAA
ncbi:MAG: DNA starvation/stationary phase protection protein, partial [Candidatus Omnitrophota bacterium]|nr:DNA starvation/stationary phase protection protein [Candidatus Omnitrophota bacterium]